MTSYTRIPHAAHYSYGHPAVGHDLEQWDYAQPQRLPVPPDVAPNAEYHSGYLDRQGVQHWVYVRTAPLSPGECPRCTGRRVTQPPQ